MALRGDSPKEISNFDFRSQEFPYAVNLVRFIKKNYDFCLGVAVYPEGHLETKTLKEDLEYAKQNIRVNCICPGVILTPGSEAIVAELDIECLPLGKAGQPEMIARAALYLASEDSSYVTGQTLIVDGGWIAGPTMLVKA